MKSALHTAKQQLSRLIWLYALAMLNGFMAFYLLKGRSTTTFDEVLQGAKVSNDIAPVFLYAVFDYIVFIISFVILFRIIAFSLNMECGMWRLFKVQIPALIGSLLLSLGVSGVVLSAFSMIASDAMSDSHYLLFTMVVVTFTMMLFYFILSIVLMIRYRVRDEVGKGKQSMLDYFKAFALTVKQSLKASLYFVGFVVLALGLKYVGSVLNIVGFAGLGVILDAMTIPFMTVFILAYIAKSQDEIVQRVTLWTQE